MFMHDNFEKLDESSLGALVSINVGLPKNVIFDGESVTTGIYKKPVINKVKVHFLNLDGDKQADLTAHGGELKAVYAYPSEHYIYWKNEFPHLDFLWGMFGENLTTQGILEDNIFIGDILQIGTTVFQVTQPRLPCYKLAGKFNSTEISRKVLLTRYTGFYLSVLTEGYIEANNLINILERDKNRFSIKECVDTRINNSITAEKLSFIKKITALPQSWLDDFTRKKII